MGKWFAEMLSGDKQTYISGKNRVSGGPGCRPWAYPLWLSQSDMGMQNASCGSRVALSDVDKPMCKLQCLQVLPLGNGSLAPVQMCRSCYCMACSQMPQIHLSGESAQRSSTLVMFGRSTSWLHQSPWWQACFWAKSNVPNVLHPVRISQAGMNSTHPDTLFPVLQMLMDLGPDVYRREFEDAYLTKASEFFKVCQYDFSSIPACGHLISQWE